MSAISISLLALALAADSFAASIAKGARIGHPTVGQALLVGLIFGGVQVAMPLLGWRIGAEFQTEVRAVDHWIAFLILSVLGIKMVLNGVDTTERDIKANSFTLPALVLTAIATSVDALVVGFGFGVLSVSVLAILLAIGIVTFVASAGGIYLGNRLGLRVGRGAELCAGLILIGIGLRILLSHLGA